MKKATTFQQKNLLGTLLMVLMTALPAWAQTPVSLSIDNDYTPDQAGYYYVNMTEFGILDIDDPSIVFKIYDDGGKNGGLMMREQRLVIQAPEEYVFELTGKAYKTGDEKTEVELTKIDETHYSFTMPFYDVTIEPSPYDWLWTSGNTICRFDNAGTFSVKAVEDTDGAMANYPTIEAPWQSHMSEIKKLVIDPSVTAIGSYAFLNFPLAEIILPEGLERIRTGAFRYANLTKVTIPATMVSISAEAFYCCDQLTDIYCYAPAEQLTWGKSMWDFIHNPDYWTYATRLHVRPVQLEAYKSKFEGKLNVTIEGDLVPTDNWTDEGTIERIED